jgi:hypothetical protein
MNPVHIATSFFSKIHFVVTFPSVPRYLMY